MPLIRPFAPADTADLYDVCLRTGADGRDASGLYAVPTLLGEVYVGPYLALEPDSAWVVEHEGRAAGYVLGAPDTAAFEAACESDWWPALRERYPLGGFPEGSPDAEVVQAIHHPHRSAPWLAAAYPAHLHIDLVDSVQGLGLGGSLIGTLLGALRERGVTGIHLGVSPANVRAIGFYEHLGFTVVERLASATVMARRL